MGRVSTKRAAAQKRVVIPLTWRMGDGVPAVYANQAVIAHTPSEFVLLFGQVVPPFGAGDQPPQDISVLPVAKIVVTPQAMMQIAKAISDNLDKYRATLAEHDKDSDLAQ